MELEPLQRMGETRVKENRKRSKHRQVAQAAEGARIGSTTDIPRNCDSNPGLYLTMAMLQIWKIDKMRLDHHLKTRMIQVCS